MPMRTSSKVEPKAVTLHENKNGHMRKDPKPCTPLAREQAKARKRKPSPPHKQHLLQKGTLTGRV